jgi:ABC-2 type transport system ATP-binding protein
MSRIRSRLDELGVGRAQRYRSGRPGRVHTIRPVVAEPVIRARGLRKCYGDLEAVGGIDLEVAGREIFAFLGPNGAGKTTTVELLEGYRERSGGEVSVLGADPAAAGRQWRQRIGIVLQECNMQPELTVRESLQLYAGYYESPRSIAETIELVGLEAAADQRAGRLSGGQQRRLDVALALVGDPELLFLDEPTTGFDPSARRQAWQVIASLRDLGKTVFLTTHYMDEAQALADRVAIIVGGAIVAEGAPGELGGRGVGASSISFQLPAGVLVSDLPPPVVEAIGAGGGSPVNGGVELRTEHPVAVLNALTAWALARDLELAGLEVHRPSLEDVYLELTQ